MRQAIGAQEQELRSRAEREGWAAPQGPLWQGLFTGEGFPGWGQEVRPWMGVDHLGPGDSWWSLTGGVSWKGGVQTQKAAAQIFLPPLPGVDVGPQHCAPPQPLPGAPCPGP